MICVFEDKNIYFKTTVKACVNKQQFIVNKRHHGNHGSNNRTGKAFYHFTALQFAIDFYALLVYVKCCSVDNKCKSERFADIYFMNHSKAQIFRFYLWVSLAYWALWAVIDLSSYPGEILARLVNDLWRVLYIFTINFIFFEYTLPYVLARKNMFTKFILFVLLVFVQMMLYSFGLFAWRALGVGLHIYTSLRAFKSTMDGVSYGVGYGVFSVIFFGVARHAYTYTKLKAAAQQLRIEKQAAELNYLRSQTNPHFLFNTLNNIYSLSRDKSDLAPESILRLSKILRFMLYETSGSYIA
ncbi:MAG TPA: histidine kinase, partial [Chitinophagaceae bacterium]|nr:histidine kinase [Chitinophagaceae bacterium]